METLYGVYAYGFSYIRGVGGHYDLEAAKKMAELEANKNKHDVVRVVDEYTMLVVFETRGAK